MIALSCQQKDVIDAPITPLAVTACAGSGKTTTAVRRLAEMRSRLDDRHGIVVLLSFSNVAVDTFNKDYIGLLRAREAVVRPHGVEIDTVDGFITSNIVRPHGHLVMGCDRCPFLVDGREPFNARFTVWDGERSHRTATIKVGIEGGDFVFAGEFKTKFAKNDAIKSIDKLGKVGAYTHSLARYWAIRVLKEQPFVLSALIRRYPHILVDEAQDIGAEHEAILRMLMDGGTQLSLIGDTHQGIYDFSGANGIFLGNYGKVVGVAEKNLEKNFRSVPSIVEIANKLSGRNDEADREEPASLSGAYIIPYKQNEKDKVLAAFASMLVKAEIEPTQATVLCRSKKWAGEWGDQEDTQGQGIVKLFAQAAVHRDKAGRFDESFRAGCLAVIGLLDPKHGDLPAQLVRPSKDVWLMRLRREIWSFLRNTDTGLPKATLVADSEWHRLLVPRAKAFVAKLQDDFAVTPGENLGAKLAKKGLTGKPLFELSDLAQEKTPRFRVSTVHKVKGESIGGVMYICNKDHVEKLVDGTGTEVGRIGYVALTRARNLFVLAVPASNIKALQPKLLAIGFKKSPP
ncbi:MAG: ATP-dependent helicase [Parvibaculum sp.]|uniref:ATP-dependent helicase n=1 Tax=Parvibaculum sp. TaxID=2024848 RepID=UPI0032EFB3F0